MGATSRNRHENGFSWAALAGNKVDKGIRPIKQSDSSKAASKEKEEGNKKEEGKEKKGKEHEGDEEGKGGGQQARKESLKKGSDEEEEVEESVTSCVVKPFSTQSGGPLPSAVVASYCWSHARTVSTRAGILVVSVCGWYCYSSMQWYQLHVRTVSTRHAVVAGTCSFVSTCTILGASVSGWYGHSSLQWCQLHARS